MVGLTELNYSLSPDLARTTQCFWGFLPMQAAVRYPLTVTCFQRVAIRGPG